MACEVTNALCEMSTTLATQRQLLAEAADQGVAKRQLSAQ